ncbi:hypothetical protein SH597_05790 [Lacticaseibacillus paracasei]|uniref:hypothetical protein n=1 Tax=Lacticaseibacillus paracasei TaxID=1597 RepID=UPI0018918A5F|nr:hypothetical protein [Lacticaseibacillus paracasei]QPB56693.1 hypothetical protein GFB64_06175 [Lacticaseibacillus paracasei]WPQ32138.1 hypothetical protein SH597_05790 [Lacticaseibacillus paracasei]
MSNEDSKTREDIMKRLLALAAEANHIKEYELGATILTAHNVVQYQLDIEDLKRLKYRSEHQKIRPDKDEKLNQVFKGDKLVASWDAGSSTWAKDYRIVVNGHQLAPRL